MSLVNWLRWQFMHPKRKAAIMEREALVEWHKPGGGAERMRRLRTRLLLEWFKEPSFLVRFTK